VIQHNLGNVITFEIVRTVKKKRFWIGIFAMPMLIVVIFALVFVSNNNSEKSAKNQKNAHFSFEYVDASGLIDQSIIKELKGELATSYQAGFAAVKSGKVAAFFAYPSRPSLEITKVFGADKGVFENGKYESVAKMILQRSVEE
jgi:ABC-2 type transport system permease protein